jgi:hypothetical protein
MARIELTDEFRAGGSDPHSGTQSPVKQHLKSTEYEFMYAI